MNCPCQSGQVYDQCCGRFISHRALPENAEQLMRSRYSAFHQGEREYLLQTWHADFRPDNLELDSRIRWIGLEVIEANLQQDVAKVEFEARLLIDNKVEAMRELSAFAFEQGRWFYTTGESKIPTLAPFSPGRNETCPCGSGMKFKRCCAN